MNHRVYVNETDENFGNNHIYKLTWAVIAND